MRPDEQAPGQQTSEQKLTANGVIATAIEPIKAEQEAVPAPVDPNVAVPYSNQFPDENSNDNSSESEE